MGIFRTHRNWCALFCRIAIAAIFIPHGLDKLLKFPPLGWDGPEVWSQAVIKMLEYARDGVPIVPVHYRAIAAQVSAWTELIAGIACVLGLLVRLAMIPLIINMVVAILLVHGKFGFWFNHTVGGIPAPGFEYNLFIILVCLGLLVSGAGSLSIDKLVAGEPEQEYEEDVEYEEYEPR